MRAQCALALAGQVQVKRITRGCKYGEIVDNLDDDDSSSGGSCTNVFGVMFQSVEDLTDRDNMIHDDKDANGPHDTVTSQSPM